MADQVPGDAHEGAGRMAVVLAQQEPGVSVRQPLRRWNGARESGWKSLHHFNIPLNWIPSPLSQLHPL